MRLGHADFTVALAGNPNTGKSTVFNALTGLRQHTGNWPGKTIARAEGAFSLGNKQFKLVDLPGTYSLLSATDDEEVARNFILFGKPDVTLIVVDATRLERNLNLVLQVLQITDKAILCVNLIDEARAHGVSVDARGLARDLGIPVVMTAARQGEGMEELLKEIEDMAHGRSACRPYRLPFNIPVVREGVDELTALLERAFPRIPHRAWVALRLLEGDPRILEAVATGEIMSLGGPADALMVEGGGAGPVRGEGTALPEAILKRASELRWKIPQNFHDRFVENVYAESSRIALRNVEQKGTPHRLSWERRLDWLLTSRWTGTPIMILMLAFLLWITIEGANIPSGWLATILLDKGHPFLDHAARLIGMPWWLSGVLVDGMYLTTAWVVSVMLPPMAIFFPLFTLLEDFGYLPRVAFNLDNVFHRAGAHGKQALTMCMGWGCNAAGVVATRVIDSPRERLIAIITNNFALCNGRWPTQILIATVFLGVLAPPAWAGIVASGAVLGVAVLGVFLTLLVSWMLSRTVLAGQASTFTLELPPYRPPNILRTLYTSLIDRTMIVLWRAVVFAAPAGVVLWVISNVRLGDMSVAQWLTGLLDGPGWLIGLNGVILLAYIVAIPANEIVLPTILMLTVMTTGMTGVGEQGAGVMFETRENSALVALLRSGGWTTLTAVCLMLFSLCHNPCSTTIYTIWKETKSMKWTLLATLLPVAFGIVICGTVALVWRLFSG
jgi:ferrous iron transport protein B